MNHICIFTTLILALSYSSLNCAEGAIRSFYIKRYLGGSDYYSVIIGSSGKVVHSDNANEQKILVSNILPDTSWDDIVVLLRSIDRTRVKLHDEDPSVKDGLDMQLEIYYDDGSIVTHFVNGVNVQVRDLHFSLQGLFKR